MLAMVMVIGGGVGVGTARTPMLGPGLVLTWAMVGRRQKIVAGLPEPWGVASAADDGQRWGPVELQALSFGRGVCWTRMVGMWGGGSRESQR